MRSFKSILKTATAAAAVLAATAPAFAAPATWSATPINNDFNNAANWSAGGPPGSGEQGTFGASNTTVVQFGNANTTTGGFTFNSGSPAYTVLVTNGRTVTIGGAGAGNTRLLTPGVTEQTITFSIDALGDLRFIGGTASNPTGGSIVYANAGNLLINGGSAGNATLQNGITGTLSFANSNGGTANIVNSNLFQLNADSNLEQANVLNNGIVDFSGNATAGSATIVNNATIDFDDTSTAGSSTITTNGGASTNFIGFAGSNGGNARFIMNGGVLDFDLGPFTNTAGSIEGATGGVEIFLTNLSVGSNNHAHAPLVNGERALTFGGTISGAGGQITKVGTGTWILSGANSYTAGTNVNAGVLQVSADNNLGAAAGGLRFDGGTLRSTGTFQSNRVVTLNAGGGTFDITATNGLELLGQVTGAGSLTKTGTGFLYLVNTANNYTGGTSVLQGTLVVGNGVADGELPGNATVAAGAEIQFFNLGDRTHAGNISGAGAITKFVNNVLTLTGNSNDHSGVFYVGGGSVVANGGNALGDTALVWLDSPANPNLTIGANETIGALSGIGNLAIGANQLVLNGTSFGNQIYFGAISGVGGSLVKNGAFIQTLNGDQTYTGGTIVNVGTLRINGVVPNAVTVNAGATFGGNFANTGDLTSNSGNVAPGNSPGLAFTGGNYIAAGAPTYTVDLFANASNVPVNGTTHDFWTIAGNVTGANTRILLDTSLNSNLPTATIGNGIEIARVGGASEADDFFLSTAVQSAQNGFVGGFQYVVNAQQNNGPGGSDQFFLRNVVREQLVANAVILSASRQVTRDCHRGTEHTAGGSGKTGAWAAARFGTFEADADTGADYTNNYACVTGGIETSVGDGWTVGLRGGYSNHDIKLNVFQGQALLDGDGWTVEGALTYAEKNYYAGITAGYQQTDWDYDHALISGGISQADADGAIASLYSGYIVGLGGDARVKFEGQVLFDSTDCDGNCFLAGTVQDTSDWQGRVLARASDTWGSVMPYLQVSLSTDFDDGQTVRFGNAISNVDTASGLFGAALGFSADAGDGWALGAELATTQGFDSEVEGYQAAFGARKSW
jgi:autotransporter-associated beta strand protein